MHIMSTVTINITIRIFQGFRAPTFTLNVAIKKKSNGDLTTSCMQYTDESNSHGDLDLEDSNPNAQHYGL